MFFKLFFLISTFAFIKTCHVKWASEESNIFFSQSKYKTDFFQLSNNFEGQITNVYCGIASATIILNSLRVNKTEIKEDKTILDSKDTEFFKTSPFYKRYTQKTVVEKSFKPKDEILGKPKNFSSQSDFGLTLEEEALLLKNFNLSVKTVFVDNKLNETQSVNEILKALQDKNTFIIINYLHNATCQIGGGHFSPLAAYDQISDRFLIMDVSNTLNSWVWVTRTVLFNSMQTLDKDKHRGYLLITENSSEH